MLLPFQRFILTSQIPSVDVISQTVKTVAEFGLERTNQLKACGE
jgi:hypothetical protein